MDLRIVGRLAAAALALESLAIAGRVLEGGEAGLNRPLRAAPAAGGGRERCRGAHHPADHERAKAGRLRLPIHAPIVRLAP